MSDETTAAPTPEEVEPWKRLLEDASTIEAELREAGWETVFLDPESVSPVDDEDRVGLRAIVPEDEYEAVESVVGRPEVTFTAVDVYRQTEGRTTVVLAVERDEESETAVLVPLYYERSDARPVFESALEDERLLVYVETDPADNWVVFTHDDPSLFLENPEEFEPHAEAEGGTDERGTGTERDEEPLEGESGEDPGSVDEGESGEDVAAVDEGESDDEIPDLDWTDEKGA